MDITNELKDIIRDASETAARQAGIIAPLPEITLDIPKDRRLCDLSTNIAMQLCKAKGGINPIKVAEAAADIIKQTLAKKGLQIYIKKIEAVVPGFINFTFSQNYLQSIIDDIYKNGESFGRSKIGARKKVLIEFVSANPTGPLSVAHGRQAAVGDVLANLLEFSGYDVKKEYYINDEGNQIRILGASVYARYCELLGEPAPFPENGYKGAYIYDVAKKIIEKNQRSLIEDGKKALALDFFCNFSVDYIMDMIKKDLSDFGVKFDSYFSQKELTKSGKIEKALDKLRKMGFIYEKDGAQWLKSSSFGDDKDRVVIKSDGSYTYIAPDIAYHEDKFNRGFSWLIDLWGPDHHGYISRLKAASQAMGRDADALSPLIIQLVTLLRNGEPVRMSTREGEFISLREVIDEVGKDVAKILFLTRRKDSHLDFDLELAKKESMENPVYYIQYAHARICGILKHKEEKSLSMDKVKDLALLNTEEEISMLKLLKEFPQILEWSALNLEPHRLIAYLMDLAAAFHLFYAKHRVVTEDTKLTAARLALAESLKTVFSRSLALLGVSCPERM